MGYYTQFELKAESLSSNPIQDLVENNGNARYTLNADGSSYQSSKWYDHEADLRALSKRYANYIFTLKGEGEEPGDIWIKYFKNGLRQESKAEMHFQPFDESKLTEIKS